MVLACGRRCTIGLLIGRFSTIENKSNFAPTCRQWPSRFPFRLLELQRSRRGGGGGLGARRAPPARPAARPASSSSVPSRSASTTPAPQQQSSGGGMLSGIGSTIAQGMAFGTGSAVAHRAVGAVAGGNFFACCLMSCPCFDFILTQPLILSLTGFGGGGVQEAPEGNYPVSQEQMQQQQPMGPCAQDKQLFFECLQQNKGDQQACSFLYENLQTCQRNDNQMQYH